MSGKFVILFILFIVTLCNSHKTHASSGEQHPSSNNEFYSQTEEIIVEEYPFQDKPHIAPSSSEKDKWITSGNLAYYTMLHATKSVYLPITVRLIFVGFEGDGNQGINLDLPNLEGWFEHIEHTLHHTWVPSFNSREEEDVRDSPANTDSTRVEYTINVEVARVCPLVTTIIEDAILQYIRPEDPDYYSTTATTTDAEEAYQSPDFYVDAFGASHVLGSLVAHLGMASDAYTLFILNPKRPFVRGESIYGYRAGLSTKEIRQIHRNGTLGKVIESLPKVSSPPDPKVRPGESEGVASNGAATGGVGGKRRTIQFSDFTEESEVWAQTWLDTPLGGLMVNPACNAEDQSQECRTATLDTDVIEKMPILDLAEKMVKFGTPWQTRYIKSVHSEGGHEQCLVDGWVSNERYAFLDLTAGPFEWGPIIGGEGVRAKGSVPRVPFHPEWKDTTIPEGEHTNNNNADTTADSTSSYDMERYRSELALLEAYWSRYCTGEDDSERDEEATPEICADLDKQIITMQESIASLEAQGSAEYKQTILAGGDNEGVNATHANDDFMSRLGATISSTIRTLFVPPAATTTTTAQQQQQQQQQQQFTSLSSELNEQQFTKRVAFHLFVIANHNQYNPREDQSFNYDEFKREVMKFRLPEQEYTFTIKSIDMSADAVLAAAFGSSLHSTVVPGITVDGQREAVSEGTFEAAPQLYIDTNALQQQLLSVQTNTYNDFDNTNANTNTNSNNNNKGGSTTAESNSKHVPIFLFSLGGNLPVFVDKYYQSVALSNMIIGVQSNFKEWESNLACNSKPVYINLRNPLRSLLASTLQYVAGLIPNHIAYSEAYQASTQNWLWSGLGISPLSILSSSGGPAASTYHFSQIQTDQAHRNFVVHSLLKAQHLLNKGVEALYAQRTTEHNLPILKHMHSTFALTNLSHYHAQTHTEWHYVASAVGKFNWPTALVHASKAVDSASMFYDRASELADFTELTECLNLVPNESMAPGGGGGGGGYWNLPAWTLPASLAGDVVIVLLWFVFRNRKAKLKVN